YHPALRFVNSYDKLADNLSSESGYKEVRQSKQLEWHKEGQLIIPSQVVHVKYLLLQPVTDVAVRMHEQRSRRPPLVKLNIETKHQVHQKFRNRYAIRLIRRVK